MLRPQGLSARSLSVQYKPTRLTLRIPTPDMESAVVTVYGNYKIPADGFASVAGDLREKITDLITREEESVDGSCLNRCVILAELSDPGKYRSN